MGKGKDKRPRSSSSSSEDDPMTRLTRKVEMLERKLKKHKRSRSHHRYRSPRGSKPERVGGSQRHSTSRDSSLRSELYYSKEESRGRSRTRRLSFSGRRSMTRSLSRSCSRSPSTRRKVRDNDRRSKSKECLQPRDTIRSPSVTEIDIHAPVDPDMISILGTAEKQDEKQGDNIPEPLVPVWSDILKSGLQTERGKTLTEAYPVPQNCLTLAPPILNPEVLASITRNAKLLRKEGYMITHQNQLAAGVSALGRAITQTLKVKARDEDSAKAKIQAVEVMNDAGRLITDLQFRLSIARRAHITPTLNFMMKGIANQNPVDTLLYGSDFKEKIETAKSISKAGKELRKEKPPGVQNQKPPTDDKTRNTSQKSVHPNLNSKRPQPQYKKQMGKGGRYNRTSPRRNSPRGSPRRSPKHRRH